MPGDIKIIWNDKDFSGDILFDDGDLVREEGLETAVLMSLFTDKRASESDNLPDPGSTDRRGWWGDQVSEIPGDEIGSKLWLLKRSKTTQDTLVKAKVYTKEALQHFIDDGVSIKNEVETYRFRRSDGSFTLGLYVAIHQKDGKKTALQFDDLWSGQFSRV